MKTVVILSTDNLGMTVVDMLNPCETKLVDMGDIRQETWNVFSDLEKGELREEIEGTPIMPVDLIVALQPDALVITATDSRKSHALGYTTIRAGFLNDIVFIRDPHEQFSIRCSVLRRLCRRLIGLGVEGNVAELGCCRDDTFWQLNALMLDRKLYLFDTFEGFDEWDVDMERKLGCFDAQTGLYSGTDKEKPMERMPPPGQVVIRKGWFPETAFDIEDETFCLIYMDTCLYQPTLAGLEFFFPRMGGGGAILLSGCSGARHRGVAKAVGDPETRYDVLLMLPVRDLDGTVMTIHPQDGKSQDKNQFMDSGHMESGNGNSRKQKSPILYVLPMAYFKIALHGTLRLSPGGSEDGKERITARRQKTHASVLGNTQAVYRQGGTEKVIFSRLQSNSRHSAVGLCSRTSVIQPWLQGN